MPNKVDEITTRLCEKGGGMKISNVHLIVAAFIFVVGYLLGITVERRQLKAAYYVGIVKADFMRQEIMRRSNIEIASEIEMAAEKKAFEFVRDNMPE